MVVALKKTATKNTIQNW